MNKIALLTFFLFITAWNGLSAQSDDSLSMKLIQTKVINEGQDSLVDVRINGQVVSAVINNGDTLNSNEMNVAVKLVEEIQEDNDEWISISGFKIDTIADGTIYAAFTGLSLGQGGIEHTFYKLFPNTETAVSYFSEKGDNWFSM